MNLLGDLYIKYVLKLLPKSDVIVLTYGSNILHGLHGRMVKISLDNYANTC